MSDKIVLTITSDSDINIDSERMKDFEKQQISAPDIEKAKSRGALHGDPILIIE